MFKILDACSDALRKLRESRTSSVCKLRASQSQCDATNLGCLEMQFPNLQSPYDESGYYRKSVREIISLFDDMLAFGSDIEFLDAHPRRSNSRPRFDVLSTHAQCDVGGILKHQASHYLTILKNVKFATP